MPNHQEKVSALVDSHSMRVVEHVAKLERRTISGVLRNVLADWAAAKARRLKLSEDSEAAA